MEAIHTDRAFTSSNPNSQAVVVGDLVYLSGQTPLDAELSGTVVGEGSTYGVGDLSIEEQTEKTFENIKAILEEAGTSLDNLVKTTVYFTDPDHYGPINEVYAEYVSEPYPARSALIIADIAVDVDIEIEAIAEL